MFFWANAGDEAERLPSLFPYNGLSPPHSILDILSLTDTAIDWELVASRAREAPQELRHRDAVRNHTALFLAIQRDAPPFVIKTFLQLYPEAARHVQRLGLAPLHLSVARGSPVEVVRYILEAWPEASSKPMSDGCVPLHFVRDIETARILLEVNPRALFITNNASYLPLHRIATAAYASAELLQLLIVTPGTLSERRHQLNARTVHGMTPLQAVCEMVERDILQGVPVCPLKWDKLVILARAADKCQQHGVDFNFCLLHALLRRANLPFRVIRYTIQTHPEQVSKVDNQGRSALCIAASRIETPSQTLGLLLKDPWMRSMATTVDSLGRCPLHYAAASGRSFDDGLGLIWKAAPLVLTIPDPQTGLYPVLLASLANSIETGETRQNTIFCLLRETPWLIPRTKRFAESRSSVIRAGCWYPHTSLSERALVILWWLVLPLATALVARFFY